MTHEQSCDHGVCGTAVYVRLMLHAGVCRGRAGVHMSELRVHEVRVVQSASTVTFAGRSQQRRESVDGSDAWLRCR